jgi:16S rRNA (guanine966-N2)-methyltransferase
MMAAYAPGRVRIIAGRWRGRRLTIPDLPGLRPTPDRVRETLFNWLMPLVEGAHCLDLFAGTGVLGFEAASRGAARVVLVEEAAAAVAAMRRQAAAFGAEDLEIVQADALCWIAGSAGPFELVFLDPPFGSGLIGPVCRRLGEGGWLRPGARIYIESELDAEGLGLPAGWKILRGRRAGEVRYYLATVEV